MFDPYRELEGYKNEVKFFHKNPSKIINIFKNYNREEEHKLGFSNEYLYLIKNTFNNDKCITTNVSLNNRKRNKDFKFHIKNISENLIEKNNGYKHNKYSENKNISQRNIIIWKNKRVKEV